MREGLFQVLGRDGASKKKELSEPGRGRGRSLDFEASPELILGDELLLHEETPEQRVLVADFFGRFRHTAGSSEFKFEFLYIGRMGGPIT